MLAGTAGALAVDPERALWTPGKLISIPKPQVWPTFSVVREARAAQARMNILTSEYMDLVATQYDLAFQRYQDSLR